MSKRSHLTTTWIGVGIVLLALSIVLLALFSPHLTAKRALRQTERCLTAMSEFDHLTVFNPLDRSGPLLPTDAEVRLHDVQEIGEIRDRLLTFVKGAKYGGISKAESGNWDPRVRFVADGETMDLYLGTESFYLSRNGQQYVFFPRDAADYTAWRELWLTSLFGGAEGKD